MSITRRPLSRFFHQLKRTTLITHITDTEGTKYFVDAVRQNAVITLNANNGLDFKKTQSRPFFIFGGDATDRGSYDLETVEMLVDFKKRYPANVALLVGNREVKNNRFKVELAPHLIHERLLGSKAPRWLPSHMQVTPFDYVKSVNAGLDDAGMREYIKSLSVAEAQLLYLQWMLKNNMGCQQTFSYRKEELQRRTPHRIISNNDVLKSFIETTAPSGCMGEYLKLSQMGVIVPHTRVMAVHGGLTPFNIGRVPEDTVYYNNARNWINKLNAWYTRQIELWTDLNPVLMTDPATTSLDEAVLPILNKPKQVVTADMLNQERQFTKISNRVSEYLVDNQLSVVLTGHQPCGDHPAIIRNQHDNVVFINGDTGYANFNPNNPSDTRGIARHHLEIMCDHDMTSLNITAYNSKNELIKTHLFISADMILGDPYVGKMLLDGSLVQCRLESGRYRLALQKGFDIHYRDVNPVDLENLLDVDSRPQLTFG